MKQKFTLHDRVSIKRIKKEEKKDIQKKINICPQQKTIKDKE